MSLSSQLLGIVGRLAANPVKNKLERNETVIKLLKELNFEPDHPPADFSGVYAYTLVEYGVGKPEPILNLFRQSEIKDALRQAFDNDNFSILLQQGDLFLDWNILGDELRELEIDPVKEFAAFAAVFIEMVKRSRTPAEVRSDRKIDNLHRQISELVDKFDRFESPSEAKIELALQAKNNLLLDSAEKTEQEKVDTFILAEQLKAWFETLNYEFDPYENQSDRFFEWIILEETRRGYDRILVRGIEGEIGVADLQNLSQVVEEQNCDEGWLVTSRRISSAAKEASDCRENKHLFCYTFDELIDEKADFSNYFKWLEAEVKNKQIDTTYVPLGCIKEEIDLVSRQVIGRSTYDEADGWIDGYIDLWLCDRSKEHISILGEFGTGKTWFTLHFAWKELQKYLDAKQRGVERPRLPIVIPLRDYAKALDVGNVIAGFFFSKHNIRLTREVFDRLNRMGKLLLIFDGFDEMADKVDRQKMINNFWELARVVTPGSKAILTCRTEHFPEAKQGRSLLNAELKASTAALTGEPPQFEVLELEKFSEAQIRQVLSFKTSAETVSKIMANSELLDLASRPVMIDLIIEALPEIEAGKPIDISRVYLYAVCRKMERDIKSERTFTSLADKLYFMCELSWEMISKDNMSLNYRLFPDRIRSLFGSVVQNETDLDHWHYDMMGQTMLIRNADGDYTPAHRSLLEFFVAYKFAAELGVLAEDFLDIARQQANIDWSLPPQDYTWSEYFQRECDEKGNITLIAPLREFSSEKMTKLTKTIGKNLIFDEPEFADKISKENNILSAILKLIKSFVINDKKRTAHKLFSILRKTCEININNNEILGGNIINFIFYLNLEKFSENSLANIMANYSKFNNIDLTGYNFNNSNLSNSWFSENTLMMDTKLYNTVLKNINLKTSYNITVTTHSLFIDSAHKDDFQQTNYYIIGYICGLELEHSQTLLDLIGDSPMHQDLAKPNRNEVLFYLSYSSKNNGFINCWQKKIKSFRILRSEFSSKICRILTCEGQYIEIDTKSGSMKFDTNNYFLNWKNADLKGATGLDAKTAHFLRLLGAINVPKIADEYNPYEDPEIVSDLKQE